MKDRFFVQIQRGDLVRVSGCYVARVNGDYVVLEAGERVLLQRLAYCVNDGSARTRADLFCTTQSGILEIIGKAGRAVG